jgi:hypothetical protein
MPTATPMMPHSVIMRRTRASAVFRLQVCGGAEHAASQPTRPSRSRLIAFHHHVHGGIDRLIMSMRMVGSVLSQALRASIVVSVITSCPHGRLLAVSSAIICACCVDARHLRTRRRISVRRAAGAGRAEDAVLRLPSAYFTSSLTSSCAVPVLVPSADRDQVIHPDDRSNVERPRGWFACAAIIG